MATIQQDSAVPGFFKKEYRSLNQAVLAVRCALSSGEAVADIIDDSMRVVVRYADDTTRGKQLRVPSPCYFSGSTGRVVTDRALGCWVPRTQSSVVPIEGQPGFSDAVAQVGNYDHNTMPLAHDGSWPTALANRNKDKKITTAVPRDADLTTKVLFASFGPNSMMSTLRDDLDVAARHALSSGGRLLDSWSAIGGSGVLVDVMSRTFRHVVHASTDEHQLSFAHRRPALAMVVRGTVYDHFYENADNADAPITRSSVLVIDGARLLAGRLGFTSCRHAEDYFRFGMSQHLRDVATSDCAIAISRVLAEVCQPYDAVVVVNRELLGGNVLSSFHVNQPFGVMAVSYTDQSKMLAAAISNGPLSASTIAHAHDEEAVRDGIVTASTSLFELANYNA